MSKENQLEKIYTKFKELKVKSKKDVIIDKTNLFHTYNTSILIEWINIKTEWQKLLRIYEQEKNVKTRELFDYYRTEFEIKLSSKEEYTLHIESDPNLIAINSLYLTVKEILLFIDATIDCIKSRAWEIKNFIEWQKFINGQ